MASMEQLEHEGKFSSHHSEFAYTLKANLEYYLNNLVSQLIVLTTKKGEIIIEPSPLEFLHMIGGHYYPHNRWKNSALGFIQAIQRLDHKDEESYAFIGLKEVVEKAQEDNPDIQFQHAYDRTMYFQEALKAFLQCDPQHIYIYYQPPGESELRADYLYLHIEGSGLPIYVGLLGKRESPFFIIHTLLIDRRGKFQHCNFQKVKVSRMRIFPNDLETKESLADKMFLSLHYRKAQKHEQKKALGKEKASVLSVTSKDFERQLNRIVQSMDSSYSIKRGSKGKSSFRLLYKNKETAVDERIPKELRDPQAVAEYLVQLYQEKSKT